jgi:hypothetical protein
MEIGQVSFVNLKRVRKDIFLLLNQFFLQKIKFVNNVKKDKMLLKKIEKTKEEKYPNLEDLKEKRMLEEKREKFKEFKDQVFIWIKCIILFIFFIFLEKGRISPFTTTKRGRGSEII